MRRILIVSYHYPPLGGVGIVQVLGTTRYLPEFGWEPTVLCAKPDINSDVDLANKTSAVSRVFARRFPFASTFMKALAKLRLDARRGLVLPDNFIDWFIPAYRAGRRALRRNHYDLIYATVPPYTSGLVAASLSRQSGVPFVLNIRDPWLDRTQPGQEHLTRLHRKLDSALERYAVDTARKLTFIYQIGLDQYRLRYPDRAHQMNIVRPAFDFERANGKPAARLPGKVTLAYAGHVYPPYDAMRTLAKLLAGCLRRGLDFTLGLWGCDQIPMAHRIVSEEGITDHVFWGETVSLREIFSIEREVTANVVLLDFKTVPTKLYEVLAAGRKILYVGPPVEDQETLLERYSNQYLCLGCNGTAPSQEEIDQLIRFLTAPDDPVKINSKKKLVEKELSAQAQTARLAAILDEVVEVGTPCLH